jgi:outer membrane lipoprotein carrier protein
MRRFLARTFSGVLLLASPAVVTAQSVDVAVDRAVAAWSPVKTARGSFEQIVTNSLTGGSATARGEFQQERPNRLAIRFTDPAGDMIVADGQAVWVYLPSSAPGQVVKQPATNHSTVPIDFTGEFLSAPRTKYDITDGGAQSVDGRATHVLKLVPKKGSASSFTRATVWVDDQDGIIRQFEVAETNGVTRRIRLTTLSLNTAVDRNAFKFTVPKGVKVVDRGS